MNTYIEEILNILSFSRSWDRVNMAGTNWMLKMSQSLKTHTKNATKLCRKCAAKSALTLWLFAEQTMSSLSKLQRKSTPLFQQACVPFWRWRTWPTSWQRPWRCWLTVSSCFVKVLDWFQVFKGRFQGAWAWLGTMRKTPWPNPERFPWRCLTSPTSEDSLFPHTISSFYNFQ